MYKKGTKKAETAPRYHKTGTNGSWHSGMCSIPSVTMWYFDVQCADQFFSSKSSTVRNRPQNLGFSRAKIKLKYQKGAQKPTL